MHTAGRMIRLRSRVREMARVRVSIRVSTVELVCYFVGILRHSGTLWAEYECDKTDNTQLYGYTRCRYIGVGLKSDGTTGQTTGHLAARGSASRYMARRKAMRQATELTTV